MSTVFMILTIILVIATLLTLVPRGSASKPCLLGYKALCPFTPISTGIMLIPTAITALLWAIL
jgi:hypothetical protein